MKLLNKLLKIKISLVALMLLSAPVAGAQSVMMSEDEALKNFTEAAKIYRDGEESLEEPSVEATLPEDLKNEGTEAVAQTENEVSTINQAVIDAYQYTLEDEFAPIEEIIVTVDLENKTLEQVVEHIIDQARDEAGQWQIKWRVKAEHNYILSERVNLIAETNLSEFMSYLVDRVNNMTGIQLFVTVFDKSRIIVISDTHY
jgi:hypothetical protein